MADNTFSAPDAASPTDDTHVTYRWAEATSTMDLFINGVATDSIAGAVFEMPTGPGHLGNVSDGGNEGMIGTIHRITTYDILVDDATIQQHANAFVTGVGASEFKVNSIDFNQASGLITIVWNSTPGEAPPQIIEIDAVGAIAVLLENLSLKPYSAASGQDPLSSAKSFEA